MPTDDERREVAQRLRESRESALGYRGQLEGVGINLFCFDQADYYLIYKAVAGCLPAEHMHQCDYAELHDRLADLIDPETERTCHFDVVHPTDDGMPWFRCSACGVTLSDNTYICMEDSRAMLGSFDECPVCHAKVVDDAH